MFNVKHLVPFVGDTSAEDSMANSFETGEEDATLIGYAFMEGFDLSMAKQ